MIRATFIYFPTWISEAYSSFQNQIQEKIYKSIHGK